MSKKVNDYTVRVYIKQTIEHEVDVDIRCSGGYAKAGELAEKRVKKQMYHQLDGFEVDGHDIIAEG